MSQNGETWLIADEVLSFVHFYIYFVYIDFQYKVNVRTGYYMSYFEIGVP